LARPARSFKDGGFSYGNTHSAILRTITFGIPGTPMPAHAGAVSEAELSALADYVIALGPPREVVEVSDTILQVTDRARVVRGFLPPAVDGAPQRPRGLLIGLTSGVTFEYRADDVRFVAVRQGEFVQRRDWTGRGGAPLLPLGKPSLVCGNGDPTPMFWSVPSSNSGQEPEPLRAQLRSTWTRGQRAGLHYDLLDASGQTWVKVQEEPQLALRESRAGVVRQLRLEGGSRPCSVRVDTSYLFQGRSEPGYTTSQTSNELLHWARGYPHEDGLIRIAGVRGPEGMRVGRDHVILALRPGQVAEIKLTLITGLNTDTLPMGNILGLTR